MSEVLRSPTAFHPHRRRQFPLPRTARGYHGDFRFGRCGDMRMQTPVSDYPPNSKDSSSLQVSRKSNADDNGARLSPCLNRGNRQFNACQNHISKSIKANEHEQDGDAKVHMAFESSPVGNKYQAEPQSCFEGPRRFKHIQHPEVTAPATSHPLSLQEALPFHLGTILTDPTSRDRYTLTKFLGRGAYALVWQARRLTDSKIFALKCLSTRRYTPEQRDLQRLEPKFHALTYASMPASIVPIYGWWEQPSAPWMWICLKSCPDGDLHTWLSEGPGSSRRLLPTGTLRRKFWMEILTAVNGVHALGVGHRDIKPENFLIANNNAILLTDFGLATDEKSCDDWECGSRPYMAPEVRNYSSSVRPYDPRMADVWSLGVVYLNLHHLCPIWSTPDETCQSYKTFFRSPDQWLKDVGGVTNAEIRNFLSRKVFVPPAARCTVTEWFEWEKSRNSGLKAQRMATSSANTPVQDRGSEPHPPPRSAPAVTALGPQHNRRLSWADECDHYPSPFNFNRIIAQVQEEREMSSAKDSRPTKDVENPFCVDAATIGAREKQTPSPGANENGRLATAATQKSSPQLERHPSSSLPSAAVGSTLSAHFLPSSSSCKQHSQDHSIACDGKEGGVTKDSQIGQRG